MGVEIERKFLVNELPENLTNYRNHKIEQGYLCTDPVIRIRRSDDDYFLTYKGKGLMVREEYNLPLTKTSYDHLKTKVDGKMICKTRYIIPIENDLMIELDLFTKPQKLALAEVEFPSEEAANKFQMPLWFREDVTDDVRYHNSNMSQLK